MLTTGISERALQGRRKTGKGKGVNASFRNDGNGIIM